MSENNSLENEKFFRIFKAYLRLELKKFLDRKIDIEFVSKHFDYYENGEEKVIMLDVSMFFGEFFKCIFKDVHLNLCILISNAKIECYLQSMSHEERNLIYSNDELQKNGLMEKLDQVYGCCDAIMQTTTVV